MKWYKDPTFWKLFGAAFAGMATAFPILIKAFPVFGIWVMSGSMHIVAKAEVKSAMDIERIEIRSENKKMIDNMSSVMVFKLDSIGGKIIDLFRETITVEVDEEMRSQLYTELVKFYNLQRALGIAKAERIWWEVSDSSGRPIHFKRVIVEKDKDGNPIFVTERIYTIQEFKQLESEGKLN